MTRVTGTVSDILRHKGSQVWSIAPNATVFEAVQMMADKNVGALLVMDGEQPVGIISERDYTRKVVLYGRVSRDTLVSEIQTTDLHCVTPEHTVQECLHLMTEHRCRHLPVVKDQKVVGLVSIGDLVNWIITQQSHTIQQLEAYISGSYPG